MNDKPFFIIIVILILFILLSRCENMSNTQTDDGWDMVNYEEFDFSIEYPNRLYMKLGNESGYRGADYIRFIVSTTGVQRPGNLIITVETKTAEKPTLHDVISWSNEDLDEIKSDSVRVINIGFEEKFLVEDQINNVPVYRRRYAYEKSGLISEEIYLARANDMVILRIRVDAEYFDEYLVIFNQMVDSFEPLK